MFLGRIGKLIGQFIALMGGKRESDNTAQPLLLDEDGNLKVYAVRSANGELSGEPAAGGGESDITWLGDFASAVFYVDQSGTSLDLQITGIQINGLWFTLDGGAEIPVIMYDAAHNAVANNQITGGPFSNFFYLNLLGLTGIRLTNNAPDPPGETPIIRYELRQQTLNFA